MIPRFVQKYAVKISSKEKFPTILTGVNHKHCALRVCEDMFMNQNGMRHPFMGQITVHRVGDSAAGRDGTFQCVVLGENAGPEFTVKLEK